jgi:hypothetical protein
MTAKREARGDLRSSFSPSLSGGGSVDGPEPTLSPRRDNRMAQRIQEIN